tara:strand:+ start:4892 stop:5986 length:1095 start_codon:yes stop_codon:yes gene_type:complete
MTKHKVTVIIPTYNRAELLDSSLSSVLQQERRPEQVIVVDDGCTDNTVKTAGRLLTEYGYSLPDGKIIQLDKNMGKAAAINHGLMEADGDLIWLWDDDDLAAPDRLSLMVPLFEADDTNRLGLVHTHAEWVEPSGQVIDWLPEDTPIKEVLRANMRGNIFFTISCLWRAEILLLLADLESHFSAATFPMDTNLERAQDYDFWMRLSWAMLRGGYHCQLFPHKTVTARNHRGPRGWGHGLAFEDIPRKTVECEQRIFEKLAKSLASDKGIMYGDIFPGFNSSTVIKQQAHAEMAFAFAKRGLWFEAVNNLRKLDRPELLAERLHRGLMVTLQSAPVPEPVKVELQRICAKLPREMSASQAAAQIL